MLAENEEASGSRGALSNVKDLLASGFFQGVPVKYVFQKHNVELDGVIDGTGYRCGCSICNYGQVLSANQFEKHSGITSSFANNHIKLPNGTSLNEVVKQLAVVSPALVHKEMEKLTGIKIDTKLYEIWERSHGVNQHCQSKETEDSDDTHQEVPPPLLHKDNRALTKFKIGLEYYEDWRNNFGVKQNHEAKQSGASTCQEIPSTFVETNHEVPVSPEMESVVTSCDSNLELSEVPRSYEVTQNHEGKQTGAGDNKSLEISSAFAETYHEVPLVQLLKGMEAMANCQPRLSSTSSCGVKQNLEAKIGAGENTSQKLPSTFMHINNEAKQNAVGVMTSEEAQPTFTQRLPTNSSFSQKRIFPATMWTNQDLEETYPRKKLRPESYSFLPPKGTEGNILKVDAFKTRNIFSPKALPKSQQRKEILSKERLNVRSVLATGLLEGLPVKYKKDQAELGGFIKDQAYLCGCSSCKYNKAIAALEFEKHAGAISNNQNNHIFLESGISLYALVKKLKELGDVPQDLFCQEIKKMICSQTNMRPSDSRKVSFQRRKVVQFTGVNDGKSNQPAHAAGLPREPEQPTVPLFDCQTLGNNSQAVESASVSVKGHRNDLSSMHVESAWSTMEGNVNSTPSGDYNIIHPGKAREDSCKPDLVILMDDSPVIPPVKAIEGSNKLDLGILKDNFPIKEKSSVESKSERKKRTCDLHRAVFEQIPVGTKLFYRSNGEKVQDGSKHENGIFCGHCEKVVSPSMFEAHAGFSSRRQPYRNIYNSEGISIHELTLSSYPNKFTSVGTFCGGEGKMVYCGKCKNSFDTAGLISSCTTDGSAEWYCSSCKDTLESDTASKVMPDAGEQSNVRLSRVIKKLEDGCCALCLEFDFVPNYFGPDGVVFCGQCDKMYHIGCLENHGICTLKEFPRPWYTWTCSAECSKIADTLQLLVQMGPLTIPERLVGMLKRNTGDKDINCEGGIDMRWSLLSGRHRTCENESFFQKATALFQDLYDPIIKDGCDVLPAMVNGQETAKEYYGGIHCAIITMNSDVVSAGLIRVYCEEFAELSLVATSKASQGKGYFQVLLKMIEEVLIMMDVKYLIVPVDKHSQSKWINKYGFVKMAKKRVNKYALDHWILMFEGTIMLEKALHGQNC